MEEEEGANTRAGRSEVVMTVHIHSFTDQLPLVKQKPLQLTSILEQTIQAAHDLVHPIPFHPSNLS